MPVASVQSPTIEGTAIPVEPDLPRMRRARQQRIQEQLEVHGLDGLVLLGSSAVATRPVPTRQATMVGGLCCSDQSSLLFEEM